MIRMLRSCLFCERSSHSKMTREHAWPNWLVRRRGPIINTLKDYRSGRKSEWKSVGKLATIAKGICEECNSGWMSQLESDAKKLLRSLMMGLSFWLSVEDGVPRI